MRVETIDVRRYLTWVRTRLSTKGQLVLPAAFRRLDSIGTGQEFEIERLGPGEYHLSLREPPPNEGLVDWLLECPEKDYFTPVESESTETLGPQ